MANQADFAQIVGKTLVRPYIDDNHQNVLLRFTDETWFNMAANSELDVPLYFKNITGHHFLFESVVVSVNIIDALDVSITTSKGTATFNAILFKPSYINGQPDAYSVLDVQGYDDNQAIRSMTIALNPVNGNTVQEIVYELLSYDI